MERIARRKPFGVGENPRNIELFQSVYDAKSDTPPKAAAAKPPVRVVAENFTAGEEPDSSPSLSFLETSDAGRALAKTLASLYHFIFYMPSSFDYLLDQFCKELINLTNGKKNEVPDPDANELTDDQIADAGVLKKIIYYFISFPLMVFIMYNWFFVLVYRDNETFETAKCEPQQGTEDIYGKPTCRPANDFARPKISFDAFASSESGKEALEFFMFFAAIPLKTFDKYVLGDNYLPSILSHIPWKILCKLIAIVVAFCVMFFVGIFESLAYILSGNLTLITAFNTALIFFYFAWYVLTDMSGGAALTLSERMNARKGSDENENILHNPKKISSILEHAMGSFVFKQSMASASGKALKFLVYVLRLIIAIMSIPISSIILNLYILFISFFGVLYFGGGVGNFFDNFNKIEEFVASDLYRFFNKKDEDCKQQSLLMSMLESVTRILYNNFYSFVVIVLCSLSIVDAQVHMHSVGAWQITLTIMVLIIATVYFQLDF